MKEFGVGISEKRLLELMEERDVSYQRPGVRLSSLGRISITPEIVTHRRQMPKTIYHGIGMPDCTPSIRWAARSAKQKELLEDASIIYKLSRTCGSSGPDEETSGIRHK